MTMVTLMSVLALVCLNLAYTAITGTFFFVDSNIPIAVFLGRHAARRPAGSVCGSARDDAYAAVRWRI